MRTLTLFWLAYSMRDFDPSIQHPVTDFLEDASGCMFAFLLVMLPLLLAVWWATHWRYISADLRQRRRKPSIETRQGISRLAMLPLLLAVWWGRHWRYISSDLRQRRRKSSIGTRQGISPLRYRVAEFRRRRIEAKQLKCAHCGYDIRASPIRCPECGNTVPRRRSNNAATGRSQL